MSGIALNEPCSTEVNHFCKSNTKFLKVFQFNELISYIQVAIYVLASGVTSFLVLSIGNRNLDENDFKHFLVNWNIINVLLLVLLSPVEALAPKLLNDAKNAHDNFNTLKFWSKSSAIFAILIVVSLYAYDPSDLLIFNLTTTVIYIAVVAKNYLTRSMLVAFGDFKAIARTSVLCTISSVSFFLMFLMMSEVSISTMYFSVAAGLVVGLISLRFRSAKKGAKYAYLESKSKKMLNKKILIRLTQMSFTALIQLGLGMSGVIVLGILGGSKNDLFIYSALSGFALVCLGFVNSAAVPMSNQISSISELTKASDYRKIFLKNIVIYVAGLIATIAFILIFASIYLRIMSGSSLEVSKTRTILTVMAIGTECMIVVPKVVLIGLGRETQILYIWASGFLVYVASMFLPFSPYTTVCMAIFNSGIYVFFTASVFAIYSISKLQINQPRKIEII